MSILCDKMGCKNLSYYESEGLRSNSLFLVKGGLEKVDRFEKKCLNYYPFGSEMPGRSFRSGDNYKHGYQGQFTEKDEEVNWDAFELRNWDGRLARWTSIDPYHQHWSPYLGMGNNPISGVDPDGGKVDHYTYDKGGNITLAKLTNDNFDLLFSASDYAAGNLSNGLKIFDQSILSSLSMSTPSDYGSLSTAFSSSADDIFKTFKTLADNTNVEWTVKGFDSGNGLNYGIGTYHNTSLSPGFGSFGASDLSNAVFSIHSHPGANTSMRGFGGEFESMGVPRKGNMMSGDIGQTIGIYRNHGNSHPYNNYVYFPKSGRLHNARAWGPEYIRNIGSDYRRFFFGSMNDR